MNKQDQMQKALLDARAICEAAEEEKRDFTAEERGKVAALLADAKRLKDELKASEGDAVLKAALAEFESGAKVATVEVGSGAMKYFDGRPNPTIGEQFVSSPEFKMWFATIAPDGRVPDKAALLSPAIRFKSLIRGRKDLLTGDSDTSAGAFVQTDYTGMYEPLGRYPTTVLDLVARRTTGSDLVEFVRQTTKIQQAAPVAEANVTTYAGSTGEVSGEKPEASMAFEKVQEPVKTIAVWIPATRRALSDASQIRSLIDQELRDDLNEEFEDQILNGDGTGENFTGILNTAGVLTQAWDTDILTTLRKARTTLAVTGRARPTAVVLHPNDMQAVDLIKDTSGRFYFGGPVDGGVPRIWRVPAVESEAIDEGKALMGDFRKAVIWDHEQASIQVSNSHEDFFIRNMVAILCELRAAFGVIRPSAFIEVAMESGS